MNRILRRCSAAQWNAPLWFDEGEENANCTRNVPFTTTVCVRTFHRHQSSRVGRGSEIFHVEFFRHQQNEANGTHEHSKWYADGVAHGGIIHVLPVIKELLHVLQMKSSVFSTVNIRECVYFFNIVNDQPSTTMSCIADKKLRAKTIIVIVLRFGLPDSGNHSSMLTAILNRNVAIWICKKKKKPNGHFKNLSIFKKTKLSIIC